MAVYNAAGVQLGYLTAERAPMMNRFIAEGRPIEAVFQQRAEFGCWVRVAIDGEPMVLPDAPTRNDLIADHPRPVDRDEYDQREWDD